MNAGTHALISRILKHEADRSIARASKEINQVLAKRGLQSAVGVLVQFEVLDQMDANVEAFINTVTSQIREKCRNKAAPELIRDGFERLCDNLLEKPYKSVVAITNGDGSRPPPDLAWQKGQVDFLERKARWSDHLEIALFDFAENNRVVIDDDAAPLDSRQRNDGGRPVAAHWDSMWAAIAVDLYLGDLQPKTQADIEKAMFRWLADHDISAGDSTVRGRARRLWHEIERRS